MAPIKGKSSCSAVQSNVMLCLLISIEELLSSVRPSSLSI